MADKASVCVCLQYIHDKGMNDSPKAVFFSYRDYLYKTMWRFFCSSNHKALKRGGLLSLPPPCP